jgi:hypothetical protein
MQFAIFVVIIGHIPQMVKKLSNLKLEIDANTLPLLENIMILQTKTHKDPPKMPRFTQRTSQIPNPPRSNIVSTHVLIDAIITYVTSMYM